GPRAASLRRNAPLPPTARQEARRAGGRAAGPPPPPPLRAHQVRDVEPRLARARGRVRSPLDAAPRAQVSRDRGMALMPPPRKPRLHPAILNLPLQQTNAGYYLD